MEPPEAAPDEHRTAVAGRVARNVGLRAAAELIGKFSTLALLAVLARAEGPTGLGVFLFAMAWTELAATPINMGLDLHFLRLVAGDRTQLERSLWNLLLLKLSRAVPIVTISWILVAVLDYGSTTQQAVYILTVAFLFESVRETLFAAFNGLERADLVGTVLVTQRVVTAAAGLVALALGYGVVAVAGAFVLGVTIATAVGVGLLARHIGLPRPGVSAGPRREMRRRSAALAAQDLVSAGVARLDAVLLSFLATQAVVGLYGAAYRLLEATIFITSALLGAFSAMYTYLDERSNPSVGGVYARSVKLSFVLLLPLAVPLVVLPEAVLELIYGDGFGEAATALQVLGPTLVLLGTVQLSGALIVARLDQRLLVRSFVVALVVNLVANVLLIPSLGSTGAAVAMLLTELTLVGLLVHFAGRAVGYPPPVRTLGAGTLAGSAMALVLWALGGLLPVALVAGALVYVGVFVLAERLIAPDELRMLTGMVRARMPRRIRELGRSPRG